MLHSILDAEHHSDAQRFTPSQQRIDSLANCLSGIQRCTRQTHKSAENIRKSARVLNNLTSPATDHSAKLANAARNLQKVQSEFSRATDMMERVEECAPAIEALFVKVKDVQTMVLMRRKKEKRTQLFGRGSRSSILEDGNENEAPDYDTDREIEEEMMRQEAGGVDGQSSVANSGRDGKGSSSSPGRHRKGSAFGLDVFEVVLDGTKVVAKAMVDGTKMVTKEIVDGTKMVTKEVVDGTMVATKVMLDGTRIIGKEVGKVAKSLTKEMGRSVSLLTFQADADMLAEFHAVALSGPINPSSLNTVVGSNDLADLVDEGKNMMEELKEAYLFFNTNKQICNSSVRMVAIRRLYNHGLKAMSTLINIRLSECGQSVCLKKSSVQNQGNTMVIIGTETAEQTRQRLTTALNNRTLMQSVGEYEEYIPLNKEEIHELRIIFECLADKQDNPRLSALPDDLTNLKVSSCSNERHSKIFNNDLKTGFLHLDVYAKARKFQAYGSMESYCKRLSNERKEEISHDDSLDLSHLEARDIVRCIEHALVVITGEQGIFKTVVAPIGVRGFEDGDYSQNFRSALVTSFSHISACVVERLIRSLEHTFFKQAKASKALVNNTDRLKMFDPTKLSGSAGSYVPASASASTAGLRILDGVRILGPTLAKICDMTDPAKGFEKSEATKEVSNLCVELHRLTVKATAKAMENFINAIINDPLCSPHRPPNAGVANLSVDVVNAIKSISSYSSAYKSVTKRRSLLWDPKTGDEAGSMDTFSKYIISKLCKNLEEKAQSYLKDSGHFTQNIVAKDIGYVSQGKCYLFIVVNMHYILQSFRPRKSHRNARSSRSDDDDDYKINSPWFKEKVGNLMERDKEAYLDIWGGLVAHLTPVETNVNEKERYRQMKIRFGGFVEQYEKIYFTHNRLQIEDDNLRRDMHVSIREKFLNQYTTFFDTYASVPFSKKKMNEYLKYKPAKIESMINELFSFPTSG